MATISLDQLPYDPSRLYDNLLVELTQSSVATFMACPQRFVLRYLMLLERPGINMALLTGSAVHKAMEIMIDPADPRPRLERLQSCEAAIDKTFDRALERSSIVVADTKIESGRAQAHALVNAWHIIHGDEFADWTVVHKEMKVRTARDVNMKSPLLDRMAGMIDGVLLDPSGRAWILEHKTRKSMMGLSLTGLELNFQILWYMILCMHVLERQALDKSQILRPVGFLYDGMMKPQHRMNTYGFEDLKARMINAIVDDPEKYFILEPIPIEAAIVDNAFVNFRRIVAHMDRLSPDTVYKNLNACGDYGGCPYVPLCRQGADVRDPASVFSHDAIVQYDFREIHTELADDVQGSDDLEKWE